MASQKLSQTLDKLDSFLQQQRGSIGSPRAVHFLNELIAIQRFVQENAKSLTSGNFARVDPLITKIKEHLGIPESSEG